MKFAGQTTVVAAAAKAGMALETARNYLKAGVGMPKKQPRDYRTRTDCFAEVLPELEDMLKIDPGLQTQTLMQWLIDQYPERYNWSHLRTLQRRVQ